MAISRADANHELGLMAGSPKTLPRPVVLVAGWMDPGTVPIQLRRRLESCTLSPQTAGASFFFTASFPACREKLVRAVESKWPSGNADETIEVDVIAHSMGGLVSRYSSLPRGTAGFPERLTPTGKRLKIRNLYTIATPHTGAAVAWLSFFDPKARDMKPGSPFLIALEKTRRLQPTIYAYGRGGDWVAGLRHTSLPDAPFQWVPWSPGSLSHILATRDPRILQDIFGRLRGEIISNAAQRTPRSR